MIATAPATDYSFHLLEGFNWPGSKIEIVDYIVDQSAGREVLSLYEGLPDRVFESYEDLEKSLGDIDKLPGQKNIFSSSSGRDEIEQHEVEKKVANLGDFKSEGN